jgi:4-hydroxy-tetrahydrodipicolinate reductase
LINVAVSGAAGRMGATVCEAVGEADDLSLTGRADPLLETALADVLGDADVVVDFSVPDAAVDNARTCLEGAVLMMQFARQAVAHMPECEIVELHHDRKLDAPSGTAARTAELIREAGGNVHEPIHSVRLPGLVAHQEVIFGGRGQILTIRHDSIDRWSFMPGVLLAIRKVGSLERSPTIGLEHLL